MPRGAGSKTTWVGSTKDSCQCPLRRGRRAVVQWIFSIGRFQDDGTRPSVQPGLGNWNTLSVVHNADLS